MKADIRSLPGRYRVVQPVAVVVSTSKVNHIDVPCMGRQRFEDKFFSVKSKLLGDLVIGNAYDLEDALRCFKAGLIRQFKLSKELSRSNSTEGLLQRSVFNLMKEYIKEE